MHLNVLKLVTILSLLSGGVFAHDPGLSTCSIQLRPAGVEATVVFALQDFKQLAGSSHLSSTSSEFSQVSTRVLALDVDGKRTTASRVECRFEGNDNVVIGLSFPCPSVSRLEVRAPLMASLPMGHRQFLTVQTSAGDVLTKQLLSAGANTIAIDVSSRDRVSFTTHNKSVSNFSSLGVKGVLAGNYFWLLLLGLSAVGAAWMSYRFSGNSSK